MKLSLILLLFINTEVNAFQVDVDSKRLYKNAVEKSTGQKIQIVPPVTIPADDNTYQSEIPFTQILEDFCFEEKWFPFRWTKNSPSLPTLSESINTKSEAPPPRKLKARKIFGIDDEPSEYWFDNRIHTFGNTGFYGGMHAAVAPLATNLIDRNAYGGVDVRDQISKELYRLVDKTNARVLDMCCGVGMSTHTLSSVFKDAEMVVGIDTSPEMISMARCISDHITAVNGFLKTYKPNKFWTNLLQVILNFHGLKLFEESKCKATFARGNAERLQLPEKSFDLVTIMYGFHEIPKTARYRILREARRLLKDGGTLAVIDICPDYKPSPTMLAGEPYVLEYKKTIQKQMSSFPGFDGSYFKSIVPGHVRMWLLTGRKSR